ncbi:hypothetical protein [Chitinimonas lacunae]|uniref:Uncharacterized protein n=1 Tax=Chitinimonas lacunae TaxID=1963018 RepID=A0ABV8MSI5_9NEIS
MLSKKLAALFVGLGAGVAFAVSATAAPPNGCARQCSVVRTQCLQQGGTKVQCLAEYRDCMAVCSGGHIP